MALSSLVGVCKSNAMTPVDLNSWGLTNFNFFHPEGDA